MERTQFTFYDSFFRAVSRIRSKTARCDAYDAICRYALTGEEPDLEVLPNTAAIVFEMVRPHMDTSRRKAEGGLMTHGSVKSASRKQKETEEAVKNETASCLSVQQLAVGISTASCEEFDSKNKNKNKNKIKNKDNSHEADFARFWEAYPRKENKIRAWEAFQQVEVPLEILLSAIAEQIRSDQWTKENGRYIPGPASWLKGRRWEDTLQPSREIPKGASGQLGQAELEAIEALMKGRNDRQMP